MTSAQKMSSWSVLILLFVVALMATLISAAPGPPNSEDYLGSRFFYRNRETLSNPEDNNIVPIALDAGQQQSVPVMYDPHVLSAQAPSENALLTYLLSRRFALANNRLRSYVDTSSNEISKKRSYSKYCSFNAVSCFGRK